MALASAPGTSLRTWPTVSVLAGLVFVYFSLEAMLSPVLPKIELGVHATPASVAWVFTGLLLSAAVCSPLIARIAETIPKKNVLLAVVAIVAVGTALSGIATSILVLAIGQVLQGVGLSLAAVALGVLHDSLPDRRTKGADALILAAVLVSSVVGALCASPIANALGYRWLYWLALILLCVLGIVAAGLLPTTVTGERHGRIDWIGALLLGVGLSLVLLGLTQVAKWGWSSSGVLALLVAGVIVLIAFTAVQMKVRDPLVDLRVGGRTVWISAAVMLAVGWASFAMYLLTPLLITFPRLTGYGLGSTTTVAGRVIAVAAGVAALCSLIVRPLEKVLGGRVLLVIACLLIAGSALVIAAGSHTLGTLVVAMVLLGVGLGIGFTEAIYLASDTIPAARVASAANLIFVVRSVGGTLGAQVSGSLVAGHTLRHTIVPAWSGFQLALVVAACVAGLAFLAGFVLPRTRAERAPDVTPLRADV